MKDIVFIHGMFQNPKSWQKWVSFFSARGFNCHAPAWPLHEGEPAHLRANPPAGLGKLALKDVISAMEAVVSGLDHPIVIGHSVGGLVAQVFANRGLVSAAVAISSVAPNSMIDLDWSFFKNVTTIANPLKGDEPALMDLKTFHGAFANTLSEAEVARAYEEFATHDSRNVLRDCMGKAGHVDLDRAHEPLLFIAGEKDQIIPPTLCEKNANAYTDTTSVVSYKEFPNRSHYICGEPGWEQVATAIAEWIESRASLSSDAIAVSKTLGTQAVSKTI